MDDVAPTISRNLQRFEGFGQERPELGALPLKRRLTDEDLAAIDAIGHRGRRVRRGERAAVRH
jgi:hypothetical protein